MIFADVWEAGEWGLYRDRWGAIRIYPGIWNANGLYSQGFGIQASGMERTCDGARKGYFWHGLEDDPGGYCLEIVGLRFLIRKLCRFVRRARMRLCSGRL